jgi:hypothetical protein
VAYERNDGGAAAPNVGDDGVGGGADGAGYGDVDGDGDGGDAVPRVSCLFCNSYQHVVAVEAPDRVGHRTVLCPHLTVSHDTDGTTRLSEVVDDSGAAAPERWQNWITGNLSRGVSRGVILAILAENRLRPRAAVALFGPQPLYVPH